MNNNIKTRLTRHSTIYTALGLDKPIQKDVQMFDMRQLSNVRIVVKDLVILLQNYINSCTVDDLIEGHLPEIRMLKNIVSRYDLHECMKVYDLEMLVCLIEINLEDRTMRTDRFAHDVLFDNIIKKFGLADYI